MELKSYMLETIKIGEVLINLDGAMSEFRDYENRVRQIKGYEDPKVSNAVKEWMEKLPDFDEDKYEIGFLGELKYGFVNWRFTGGQDISSNSKKDKFKRFILDVNFILHYITSNLMRRKTSS